MNSAQAAIVRVLSVFSSVRTSSACIAIGNDYHGLMVSFRQILLLWILLLFPAGLPTGLLQAMDQIALKSGETLEGHIIDSEETPSTLTLEISMKYGITSSKVIPKDSIEKITRSQGEDEPAFQLELPEYSAEASWYEKTINQQIKPWLEHYPNSIHRKKMVEKNDLFIKELLRVQRGDHRLGSVWYSAEEYRQRLPEIQAEDLARKYDAAYRASNYTQMAHYLRKGMADYASTEAFRNLCSRAKKQLTSAHPAIVGASLAKRMKDLQAEFSTLENQVRSIVNRLPPQVPEIPPNASFTEVTGTHAGAEAPDYRNAKLTDHRVIYNKRYYVKWEDLPGYYIGSECEYNLDTKYYYNDPLLPKKKLSDDDIREVISLYRQLADLKDESTALSAAIQDPGAFIKELAQLAAELP